MKKIFTLIALSIGLQQGAYAGIDDAMTFYRAGNIEMAVKELEPLALQGDVSAQYLMGAIYDRANGVWGDDQRSLFWYRQAAQQGQPQAQYKLGVKYGLGQGVPQDSATEIAWYRKAAEQGNADAQYNLSVMLSKGVGEPQDFRQSAFWCRQAAEQGHVPALYNLGIMYRIGRGVPLSDINAYMLLNLAAGKGHQPAEKYKALVAKNLSQKEIEEAQTKSSLWKTGTALPLVTPRT